MFYKELRWEEAAHYWEKGEPLYSGKNTLPIFMEDEEEAKRTNTEGISFYAELEYLTLRNGGLTHFWKKEGYHEYSGDKPYTFVVAKGNAWYSIIGKWRNKEDAKKEITACGYTIVEE